jgi:hypothetical protein
MKLTSEELADIQAVLTKKIIKELKKPMTDFELVARLELVTGKIDEERRKVWNDEHFGVYKKIADQLLPDQDDIPF